MIEQAESKDKRILEKGIAVTKVNAVKKLAVLSLTVMIAACFFGCSAEEGRSDSGSTQGTEQTDQNSSETVHAYMTDPAVVEVMQNMNDDFKIMLDCFESGQYVEAEQICLDAINACNEVLDMENVPDQAKEAHEKVSAVAQSFWDTFFCFELAAGYMQNGDVKEATMKVGEGNEYYGHVGERIDEVTALLAEYV